MSVGTAEEGTASALTRRCLENISTFQDQLHAFITVTDEQALEAAARADAATERGQWLGVLHGIPIGIKDVFPMAGVRATMGSDFYRDYVPERDAEAVRRLRAAGAVIVGKENTHEFAFGATTQNPHYGNCRNPWDTDRIPGGSSGGSGVAVAAGMTVASFGSDAGGSVRVPAALNGVAGLRPTMGRVSNDQYGVTQGRRDFSTGGPLARRVTDVARMLVAVDAYDPTDVNSVRGPRREILSSLFDGIEGLRIGLPTNFFFDDVDPEIEAAVRAGAQVLEGLGARLVEVHLPGAEQTTEQNAHISPVQQIAFQQERMAQEPERFSEDVLRRLTKALDVSAADYAKATMWCKSWCRTVDQAFENLDMILTPSSPVPAPLAEGNEAIATTLKITAFARPWSLTDAPALSVPCGFTDAGLPAGLQLVGRPWEDGMLLRAGVAFQAETDWHTRIPPVGADPFAPSSVRA